MVKYISKLEYDHLVLIEHLSQSCEEARHIE